MRTPPAEPDARERELLRALGAHPLARAAATAAAAVGTPLHLVGGAVRDALLGRATADLDAVVAGGVEALAAALARRLGGRAVRLGGGRFAAHRVIGGAGSLDLWDRGGGSLESDLARRDLTVNAMALHPASGALTDPLGGLGDLRRRLLRATREETFREDPLRVLRLARLGAELPGFEVEEATCAAARRAAAALAAVAAERIRDELLRLLAAPGAAAGLALLATCGAEGLFGPGATAQVAAAAVGAARLEAALPRLAEAGLALPPGTLSVVRLAALARGLGGPHRLADLTARRWLAPAAAAEATRLLREERLPRDDPEARRFLHRTGDLWASAVALLAASGAASDEEVARLARLEARHGADLRRARPLLPGGEIARLAGCAPGPALGTWVERLRCAEVEGEVSSVAEARAWLEDRARRRTGA